MFNVVLYQPEIPPNTGNIIRLCANTGCQLHLIAPLGFALDNRRLRRAGLDYHEWVKLQVHSSLSTFIAAVKPSRVYLLSKYGKVQYSQPNYVCGDTFLFGSETSGLPSSVFARYDHQYWLRLPMLAHSRSLNLANAVAITVFEAWRQLEFCGGI